jgi:hypothetical protein
MCPECKAGVLYECVACSSNNYPPQGVQEPWRESASDYERGVIDGRQMQAQSSVDKAVNAMTQRKWVGLTPEEVQFYALKHRQLVNAHYDLASDTNIITTAFEATVFYETVEQALKERNG